MPHPRANNDLAAESSSAAVRLPRQILPGNISHAWYERSLIAAGFVAFGVVLLGLFVTAPGDFGLLLLLGAGAFVAVALGLRSPVLASMYLLVATFFRLAVPSDTLPIDPFVLAFAGVVAASGSTLMGPHRSRLSAFGAIECAMALFVVWNLISMIAPHLYDPGETLGSTEFSVVRFILIGTVMPYTMFLVGRYVFVTESAIRFLLWTLLATTAYSAAVSIMQFHGPASLVWPRYIVNDPAWAGRAVGVFNQPVVNGLVLICGFLVAVLIASHRSETKFLRVVAVIIALATAYGIFLTHTRAVWLSFALVVVIGAVRARGFRRGFVAAGAVAVIMVAVNWSTFTSDDRDAGGVGSTSEVEDRLNTIATSIWAVERQPLIGWGIGRYTSVNTYHHQQWSPSVSWERGYGINSHFDALGILVELGIVGFVLWATVLIWILLELGRAARRLPDEGLYNRPLALTASMAFVAWMTTGLTVDLRLFDFPNIVVMLLAGAALGRAHHHSNHANASNALLAPIRSEVAYGPPGSVPR